MSDSLKANIINGVTVTGAAATNNVLTASSSAAASWQAPAASGITELTGGVTAGPGSGSQAATVVTNANLNGDVTSIGNVTTVVNLGSTGSSVNVNAALPPTAGQVLTATSAIAANWQTPSGGGGGVTSTTYTIPLPSIVNSYSIPLIDGHAYEIRAALIGNVGNIAVTLNNNSTNTSYFAVGQTNTTTTITADSNSGTNAYFKMFGYSLPPSLSGSMGNFRITVYPRIARLSGDTVGVMWDAGSADFPNSFITSNFCGEFKPIGTFTLTSLEFIATDIAQFGGTIVVTQLN